MSAASIRSAARLRLGVLYDLLGRQVRRDVRVATIDQFATRYRIDREHAARVAAMAVALHARAAPGRIPRRRNGSSGRPCCTRPAFRFRTRDITSTARTSCRTPTCRDFPPANSSDLALLVLGCRGGLAKMEPVLADPRFRARLVALRLAVLFHHARRAIATPKVGIKSGARIRVSVPARWLKAHPLTAHLLANERDEWTAAGYPMRFV